MKRSLLLTFDFPPVISGISTLFYHLWKHYDPDRAVVMTSHADGDEAFDRTAVFRAVRFHAPRRSAPGKIASMVLLAIHTAWYVLFRGVREIHAGQILSSGPIGWFFQKTMGVPCFLWVYGGETTAAYRRNRLETWLVKRLLRDSKYLVTVSPGITREFLDFGIPRDRIIEILPGVDADVFNPGPRPRNIVERFGLDGKHVLLTVARITKRKGHDLVLRAMSLMKDRTDIHYIIVGSGEDRERLGRMTGELGLDGRVSFAGRVDDTELPDYYRLCDIYVMPNREVTDSTDSIEGFGISFIEANACGKPSIGGRSGGADAAVADGVSGYLIDPESPEALAEKIRYLIDNPDEAAALGNNGRERVISDFSWKERARELAEYMTVDALRV